MMGMLLLDPGAYPSPQNNAAGVCGQPQQEPPGGGGAGQQQGQAPHLPARLPHRQGQARSRTRGPARRAASLTRLPWSRALVRCTVGSQHAAGAPVGGRLRALGAAPAPRLARRGSQAPVRSSLVGSRLTSPPTALAPLRSARRRGRAVQGGAGGDHQGNRDAAAARRLIQERHVQHAQRSVQSGWVR